MNKTVTPRTDACPRCGSKKRDRFAYELRADGAYNGCRPEAPEDPWVAPHDPWHNKVVTQ